MRQNQLGVTLIGWIIVLAIVGLFALGAIRLIPIYAQKMEVYALMSALVEEFDGKNASSATIKKAIRTKYQVKDITVINSGDFKVSQVKDGHQVLVQYEHKAPYIFDVGLFVTVDHSILLRR